MYVFKSPTKADAVYFYTETLPITPHPQSTTEARESS